jgi:hypothetical protein
MGAPPRLCVTLVRSQQLMAKATSLCSLAVGLRGEPTCSTIGWLTRVGSPYSRGSGSPRPLCRPQPATRPAPCGAPERRRTSCQTNTEPFPPTGSGALCAGVRLCTATVPWMPSHRQTARRCRGPCLRASAFLCHLKATVSCGAFYERTRAKENKATGRPYERASSRRDDRSTRSHTTKITTPAWKGLLALTVALVLGGLLVGPLPM